MIKLEKIQTRARTIGVEVAPAMVVGNSRDQNGDSVRGVVSVVEYFQLSNYVEAHITLSRGLEYFQIESVHSSLWVGLGITRTPKPATRFRNAAGLGVVVYR